MFFNLFPEKKTEDNENELKQLTDANNKFDLEVDRYITSNCNDPKDANLALENVRKILITINPNDPYNSYKLKKSNFGKYNNAIKKFDSITTKFKDGYKKCEEDKKEKYFKDGYVLVNISDSTNFDKEIDYYYHNGEYKKLGKFIKHEDGLYFFTNDETNKIIIKNEEFKNFLIKNPTLDTDPIIDPNTINLDQVPNPIALDTVSETVPVAGGKSKKTRRCKNKKRLVKRRSSKK
jgi:hypothetical protein